VCATPVVLMTAWSLAALSRVGFTQWVGRVIAGETFISTATLGVGLVLAGARYRTATNPISRQQLKWLAGGACISGTLAVTVWFLPGLLLGESLLPAGWLGFSGLPLLAGLTVAVLRYRLFDVDRIISRRLAYGLLTVLLGGGYAVVVLGPWASTPAWSWPPPPWPWPRPSSRPGAASRPWSTGASTAATTPLRRDAGRPTGRGRAGELDRLTAQRGIGELDLRAATTIGSLLTGEGARWTGPAAGRVRQGRFWSNPAVASLLAFALMRPGLVADRVDAPPPRRRSVQPDRRGPRTGAGRRQPRVAGRGGFGRHRGRHHRDRLRHPPARLGPPPAGLGRRLSTA
jgi:hypothetical protein